MATQCVEFSPIQDKAHSFCTVESASSTLGLKKLGIYFKLDIYFHFYY